MYVLDVIPLSRTAPPQPLSYRSSKAHAIGTMVSLDIRKRATIGIVVACDPASHRKAELKAAHYTLRGSRDAIAGSLPEWFMDAAHDVARQHATTIGAVLSLMLAHLADNASASMSSKLPSTAPTTEYVEDTLTAREKKYQAVLEGATEDRPTMFVVPTLREAAYWKRVLGRRIKGSVIVTTPEKSLTIWATTPPATVIIERAGSGSYTLPKRPYLDVRIVHRLFAEAFGSTYVLGDLPLPIEMRPNTDAPLAIQHPSPITVVDARREEQSDTPWKVIPEHVAHTISDALEHGGRVLLLGVRAGYAPAVVCRDCGQTVVDDRGRALTFSMERGERIFRSVDGTTLRPADTSCARCGSWHLVPLGIGVERILEEVRERWSDASIAYLPPDVVGTSKKSREALQAVEGGGIIIGTEAMLPLVLTTYGVGGCTLGVLASADSLLAMPFWRSRERFMRLSFFFSELASKTLILTRRPEDTAVGVLATPTSADFFVEESGLRKALSYPPFGTLIRLSREGTVAVLDRLEPTIERATQGHVSFTIPEAPVRGALVRHTTILMIPAQQWPNRALAEQLAALPPSVLVRVDPESLW